MPLPPPPTRRPDSPAARQAQNKANNELLSKGALCALIGLGVLVSPYFMASSGMRSIVGQASLVGWFALAVGIGLIGLYVRRRQAAAQRA